MIFLEPKKASEIEVHKNKSMEPDMAREAVCGRLCRVLQGFRRTFVLTL